MNFDIKWIFLFSIVIFLALFDIFSNSRKYSSKIIVINLISAFLFGLYIAEISSVNFALQYYNGYLIELLLSIDNLFIIILIFEYFKIEKDQQPRLLTIGIISAAIFRCIFVIAGIEIIHKFEWVMYIFALILLYTSFNLYKNINNQHNSNIEQSFITKYIQKYILDDPNVKSFFIPSKFAISKYGAAFIAIELTDLIFAIDSIPAILSITQDKFIAYSSNIFAILGLRAMYFQISKVIYKVKYIKYFLIFTLFFIAVKIIIAPIINISSLYLMLITISALLITIVASFIKK